MNLAPIILFTYNRLEHTKKVLESLMQNKLAKNSELYIFCDGIKDNATNQEISKSQKLQSYLKDFKIKSNNFKNIHLVIQDKNIGLADSIINGISKVIKLHKKAIILEDDIIVSKVFLDYMNESLNKYEKQSKVWSINAWSYPIDSSDLNDCYFWRIPHCWGWGTWEDRWNLYARDIKWVVKNFNKADIKAINLEGYANYFNDFLLNKSGKIKTWAIFNYLICYKSNALNLAPKISYIKQIGFDGSGVHCGSEDIYNAKFINEKFPISFPLEIKEDKIALNKIQQFHKNLKKPLILRIKNKILKIYNNGGGIAKSSYAHTSKKAA